MTSAAKIRVLLAPEDATVMIGLARQGQKVEGLPEEHKHALARIEAAVTEGRRRTANRRMR